MIFYVLHLPYSLRCNLCETNLSVRGIFSFNLLQNCWKNICNLVQRNSVQSQLWRLCEICTDFSDILSKYNKVTFTGVTGNCTNSSRSIHINITLMVYINMYALNGALVEDRNSLAPNERSFVLRLDQREFRRLLFSFSFCTTPTWSRLHNSQNFADPWTDGGSSVLQFQLY